MNIKEPLIVLWYAKKHDTPCAKKCFERLRVHYPGVLVILIGDAEVGMNFSYSDGRCRLYNRTIESQLDVWKAFREDDLFFDGYPSALLWPAHLYIGTKPLGPCIGDKFFFVSSTAEAINYRPVDIEIRGDARWPTTLGLSGYIRRKTLKVIDCTQTHYERSFVYQLVSNGDIGYEYKEDSFDAFIGERGDEYIRVLEIVNAPILKVLIGN